MTGNWTGRGPRLLRGGPAVFLAVFVDFLVFLFLLAVIAPGVLRLLVLAEQHALLHRENLLRIFTAHGPSHVEAGPSGDQTFLQADGPGIRKARVDNLRPGLVRPGIGHEVLDMGPHAFARRLERRAANAAACRAEAAEVVLPGLDVPAKPEKARFHQGLGKGQVRPDAFPFRLFPVQVDNVPGTTADVQDRRLA